MEKESMPLYKCHVTTNRGRDTFVGIRSDGGRIEVHFPICYRLGQTGLAQKNDIQLLIRVLTRFSGAHEGPFPQISLPAPKAVSFPIQAYLTVLTEYYRRGYYTENESFYTANGCGPKSWPRTIKTQRAYPQDDSFIYLTAAARKSKASSSSFITKINEFCVEEAYQKIGFLFPARKAQKPSVLFHEKRFVAALRERLRSENNDKNKALFLGMIDMIQYIGRNGRTAEFFYGTDHFEYVWERLIDFNFGIGNKSFYFPRTSWYLGAGGRHVKPPLEPDTIMRDGETIFILDAKYYRYGGSGDPADLPTTSSIHKQITYGEYVATDPKFKDKNGRTPSVYNVFLMPFNQKGPVFPTSEHMLHIGEARGDWKSSGASYERLQGVLLDLKWMMSRTVQRNAKDISQLARLVERAIQKTGGAQ